MSRLVSLPPIPAPGWILVAPNPKDNSVGETQLAVKTSEYHEGVILSVGVIPRHFKGLRLNKGDVAIYARYNAVETSFGQDGGEIRCRLVGMQHISAIRRMELPKRSGFFHRTGMSSAFASGVVVGMVGVIFMRNADRVVQFFKRYLYKK